MSITSIDRYFVGTPNIVGIVTTDNIATITTVDYWKTQIPIVAQLINGIFEWSSTDLILMYYATNQVGFFTYDATNLTFVELVVPGDVSSINATAPILANGVSGTPQTGSVTLSLDASETVTPEEVQRLAFNYVSATNIGDAYTVNLTPAAVSLTNGLLVSMTTTHANTTTSPTLQVDALPAKTISSLNNAVPVPGDIAVGFTYLFIYNSAHDAFQLLNPSVSEPNTFSVQANAYNYALDTGIANAYIANIVPPQQAISAGMGVIMQATHSNSGASTLTVNGTAHPIVTSTGLALVGGEILSNNIYYLIYNGSSTSFVLLNSSISTGGLIYNSVSGTTQAMAGGNAYIFNNAGATTGTLPTTGASTIGDTIKIKGRSAAPWIIQANTGQIITDGNVSSTTAGTATSAAGTDSIQLVYVAANEWSVDWSLSSGIVLA